MNILNQTYLIEQLNTEGNQYFSDGQLDKASEKFIKALEIDPSNVQILVNLGSTLIGMKNYEDAEFLFKKAIEIGGPNADYFMLLSAALLYQEKKLEAAMAHSASYVMGSPEGKSKYLLGKSYTALGQIHKAHETYVAWLSEEPENPIAKHLAIASAGTNIPERCPNQYVQRLFDDYADSFDQKLLDNLQYEGPKLLKRILNDYFVQKEQFDILDIGCGTGLSASILKPYSFRLGGIDISPGMLKRAEQINVYDWLDQVELTQFLIDSDEQYGLIACIDTLIYFGKIDQVLLGISDHIKKDGFLVVTNEISHSSDKDYEIDLSGRYKHHPQYFLQALDQAGFQLIHVSRETIREELEQPVLGLVILAQKIK